MSKPLPPFSCTYSPNVPELLSELNITLALSTYQAGKVIFISALNEEKLIQLPRNFDTAMGLAVKDQKIAVATKNEVVVLSNSPGLSVDYPEQPGTYDGLYAPRAIYFAGHLSLHDMDWGAEGLIAVNTLFSCISKIDDEYSFKPLWQPPFITELSPADRCHLNGMAMDNGYPTYVTALGQTDSPQGWRENKISGGVLLHVPSREIILENLSMPHSPRIYDEKLYLLLSAAGELICVDTEKGTYETVNKMNGFVRGMARFDDYLFIGLSKLRQTSSAFKDLPIAKESTVAGIVIIFLPRGTIVGHINYQTSVEEIYDVKVLSGLRRPGLMSLTKETHRMALTMPEGTYWAVQQSQ